MAFRAALVALFLCLGVAGQTCTSVSLASPSANVGAAATNGTFTVSGNPTNCLKSAASNSAWITISFGGGTANPSTVGYTVQANGSPSQRVGTISVNGGFATFTVTQAGISCSYSLSPASATVGANGGTGSSTVSTTSECPWTPVPSAGWISITSSGGTGNGSFTYSVQANPTTQARSGAITVGNATLSINQGAGCTYTMTPNYLTSVLAETGNVSIAAERVRLRPQRR